MKYFWTFFWAIVLGQTLNYVVSSMNGQSFDFMQGIILSIIFTICVLVISAIIPDGEADASH